MAMVVKEVQHRIKPMKAKWSVETVVPPVTINPYLYNDLNKALVQELIQHAYEKIEIELNLRELSTFERMKQAEKMLDEKLEKLKQKSNEKNI